MTPLAIMLQNRRPGGVHAAWHRRLDSSPRHVACAAEIG